MLGKKIKSGAAVFFFLGKAAVISLSISEMWEIVLSSSMSGTCGALIFRYNYDRPEIQRVALHWTSCASLFLYRIWHFTSDLGFVISKSYFEGAGSSCT